MRDTPTTFSSPDLLQNVCNIYLRDAVLDLSAPRSGDGVETGCLPHFNIYPVEPGTMYVIACLIFPPFRYLSTQLMLSPT